MKLDLVPTIDNSLLKLLSGSNDHQSQLLTQNRGFSLTNALAQQIVQMDSGDQVRKISLTQRYVCSHSTLFTLSNQISSLIVAYGAVA